MAHGRRRRRRAYRGRAGRTGPRAGRAQPARGVPHLRAVVGPGGPGRRGQGAAGHLRRPALRQGGQGAGAPRASSCAWAPGSWGSTPPVSTSTTPTGRRSDRRPHHHLGCRGRKRPRWPAVLAKASGADGRPSRPDRRATRPHAAGASRGVRRRRHGLPRTTCPGVAEVAMQGGLHAANTIVRRLKDESTKPFKYRDLGQCGHHRPIPGHRERQGDPPERLPGLGRLDVRPPGLPDRLRQPPLDHAASGSVR